MKVLLVTPNFHQPRGNSVTVQRIADGLKKIGVQSEIFSLTDDYSRTTLPQADLVHGFHAHRFYKFKEKLDQQLDKFVITLTGTDLNHDLFNENKRDDVIRCLEEAKAIHVFDDEAKDTLVNEIPSIESKIYIIHQGTSRFSEDKLDIHKEKNTFLFVLPAGIRTVKNIPAAIGMVSKLYETNPMVRLWLVGPIIEDDEAQVVKDLVAKNNKVVTYIGQLDHSKMGFVYKQADAILNTSHSEGQSAAVLEGMAYGLPVLVSSNRGNRNIVTNGVTGMVYNSSNQFLDYAEQIVNNIKLRNQIGQSAKQYIIRNHSSVYEAEHLVKVYQDVL